MSVNTAFLTFRLCRYVILNAFVFIVFLEPGLICRIDCRITTESDVLNKASAASDSDRSKPQLTLQSVTTSSLTVRWLPPSEVDQSIVVDRGCPEERYIVRLRQEGIKQTRAWRLEGSRQTVTLHDLNPSTTYQVRLTTILCHGKRKSTRWMEFTTASLPVPDGSRSVDRGIDNENQAPGPPSSVRTRALSDSIVVTWSPPEDSALVRGYMIGYGEGVPDVNWRYVSQVQREIVIHGLKSSTQYVISVRALNNFGKGQVVYEIVSTREASTIITSFLGGTLPAPILLKSNVLSPTSASLQWKDPSLDSKQRITDERYYNVYYQALPAAKNLSVIVKALQITLYDLQPNQRYQFKVRTVKGVNTSPFSDSITNKTLNAEHNSSHKPLKVNHEESGTSKLEGSSFGVWSDYDYEDGKRIEEDTNDELGELRPTAANQIGRIRDVQHSEVKKKRAHNIIAHESLARTLLPTPLQTASSDTLEEPVVSFRSTVQHHLSAYVTWPERLIPCSTHEPVAGYIIRYKAFDDLGEYVVRNIGSNYVLLEDLLPNVRYKYNVKYVMEHGGASAWSQEGLLDTHYNPTKA